MQRNSEQRACQAQGCGRLFTAPRSALLRGRRFCSSECAHSTFHRVGWARAKPKVVKACETCGVEILAKPHQAERKRFCSQACLFVKRPPSHPKLPRVSMVCQQCGVTFRRMASIVARGRGRFCSRRCVGVWVAVNGPRTSLPENRFFEALAKVGIVAERHRDVLGYVVDGYVPAWNLMIEVDGDYWHSLPAMKARDQRKDAALRAAGFRVRRFPIGRIEPDYPALARELVAAEGGVGHA